MKRAKKELIKTLDEKNQRLFSKPFKDVLIELRHQKNISQVELSKVLNIGYSKIRKLENGEEIASPKEVLKIADYFDVSMWALLFTMPFYEPLLEGSF